MPQATDIQVWHLSVDGRPACGVECELGDADEPAATRSKRCTICGILDEHWRKTDRAARAKRLEET